MASCIRVFKTPMTRAQAASICANPNVTEVSKEAGTWNPIGNDNVKYSHIATYHALNGATTPLTSLVKQFALKGACQWDWVVVGPAGPAGQPLGRGSLSAFRLAASGTPQAPRTAAAPSGSPAATVTP
jgi:hypothetical protein